MRAPLFVRPDRGRMWQIFDLVVTWLTNAWWFSSMTAGGYWLLNPNQYRDSTERRPKTTALLVLGAYCGTFLTCTRGLYMMMWFIPDDWGLTNEENQWTPLRLIAALILAMLVTVIVGVAVYKYFCAVRTVRLLKIEMAVKDEQKNTSERFKQGDPKICQEVIAVKSQLDAFCKKIGRKSPHDCMLEENALQMAKLIARLDVLTAIDRRVW